ncbi:YARHG domain-containing protein [Neobacillus cucumis]|uniref:YARHG domain-containing protein n=1 Tax=Neobacillus cucumis TaxID=1740721 RepID=UPI00285358D1|nr:YARHG domain-containing protein [Neobacillus cucumis]MDR4949925.1 YARHG domain-containing protein [Neobacillus cucumis]
MKFCTDCGEKLNETDFFCTHCGMKVKEDEVPVAQQPLPPIEPIEAREATTKSSETTRSEYKKGKSKKKRILMGMVSLVGVVIIAGAAYFFTMGLPSKKATTAEVVSTANQQATQSSSDSTKSSDDTNQLTNNDPKTFEEIPIVDGSKTYQLGQWKVENDNGVIQLSATEIPSATLEEIFSLYDSRRYEPLKQWAKKVYTAAVEMADANDSSYTIKVGNNCVAQSPSTLPEPLRNDYSGSCGYSIPVLKGSNKTDLILVLTENVFSSDANTSIRSTADYIIPDSKTKVLSESEIDSLTKSELRLARNEIYARHGYVFKSADLQNYFSKKSWYTQNSSYNGSLTTIEQQNINLLKAREDSLN